MESVKKVSLTIMLVIPHCHPSIEVIYKENLPRRAKPWRKREGVVSHQQRFNRAIVIYSKE